MEAQRDVRKVAQDSKVAFQAGDYIEANLQLAAVRAVHPDAEQGPNGEVLVDGEDLAA
jgi:hypothetical protein